MASGTNVKKIKKNKNIIRKGFDDLALHYDTFNDIITWGLHRIWKKKLIRLSNLKNKNIRALDLCCGSGDISLKLKFFLGENSEIFSVDFSKNMLSLFKNKIEHQKQKKGKARITLIEGDVTNLKIFKKQSIDLITIGFGLRNVQSRPKVLKECRRLLKKNAPLLILDVGKIKIPIIKLFHDFYFEKIVPKIGSLLQGFPHKMYSYLPASAKEYPSPKEISIELKKAGFTNVYYINLFFGSAVLHKAIY